MNNALHLGKKGTKLVHEFEGCHQKCNTGFRAYNDPIGVLTIGWGHTNHHGRKFKAGDIWTQTECDAEFASDMERFEAAVKKLVKVPLNQNQFDALVSFSYNCGEGNLKKSTLLRKVNAGDFKGAAAEFSKWNKAGGKVLRGLTRRREAEAKLFMTPVKETPP
jgi:lysozyme